MVTKHSTAMSMTNDPVPSATAALSNAGAALGDAAGEMAGHVRGFFPAVGKFLSQAVYTSCYCVSYGVTFPTVFLVNVIPGGIPLATGFADGARSARDYVRGMRERSAGNKQILEESPDEARATMDAATDGVPSEAGAPERPTATATQGRSKTPTQKRTVKSATHQAKTPSKRKKPDK
jgi:hypothetical protein